MADREGILGFDGPGAVMLGEADFGIILDGFRGRQQDEHRPRSHLLSGLLNQLNADAFPLVRYPHREVGQVTDVAKVRERARYSNQRVVIPGGDDEIRVPEHVGHDLPIIHRSSFPESGSVVKLDDLIEIQVVAVLIPNTVHFGCSLVGKPLKPGDLKLPNTRC
jgi:hypothetical protein